MEDGIKEHIWMMEVFQEVCKMMNVEQMELAKAGALYQMQVTMIKNTFLWKAQKIIQLIKKME